MGWREEKEKADAADKEARELSEAYQRMVGFSGLVKGTQSDNEKPISNFQCPRCGCNTIIEVTDTLLNSKQLKCICERHSCDWER